MEDAPATPREAIVLIPGIDSRNPGEILAKLKRGILSSPDLTTKTQLADVPLEEATGQVLQLKHRRNPRQSRELHLFECYWGDTVLSLTKRPIREQITRGGLLLKYWAATPVLRCGNWYIAIGGVLAGFALLLWWYGLTTTAINTVALPSGKTFSTLVRELGDTDSFWLLFLREMMARATEWWIGLSAFLLGGVFSILIDSTVNILNFVHHYLENENLRQRIWHRLSKLVHDLETSGEYDRITLLSHSFGTVIHVDFLADYTPSAQRPTLRHITLGGPVAVVAMRSARMGDRMEAALRNHEVQAQNWHDYYSDLDWMCTAMPDAKRNFGESRFKATGRNICHRSIKITDVSFVKKLMGSYHTRYFEDAEVIERLLD